MHTEKWWGVLLPKAGSARFFLSFGAYAEGGSGPKLLSSRKAARAWQKELAAGQMRGRVVRVTLTVPR